MQANSNIEKRSRPGGKVDILSCLHSSGKPSAGIGSISKGVEMKIKHVDKMRSGIGTLNIEAHPVTFRKWWKEQCQSWITLSATKYCNQPRRAFGVYVIDGPSDAIDLIASVNVRFQ